MVELSILRVFTRNKTSVYSQG